MKKVIDFWKFLSRSIYVGDRKKSNLIALTLVSITTCALGILLLIINIHNKSTVMMIASVITIIASVLCALFAGILKNRELAGIIPTAFCAIAFTLYTLTGAGNGTAIFWAILLPIGVSYFVSVRNGMILSIYYSLFYIVVFITPVKRYLLKYYDPDFMTRFALLFVFLSVFTGIAMVQYHKTALFEIEHTDKLNEEVAKQTKVATDRTKKLEELNIEVVRLLAHSIDAKDRYTKGHSFRVSRYSVALAKELGWSESEQSLIRREALLHDIGKIGIPDSVLNKPGKLTEEEFSVIKSHAALGGDILKESSELYGASKAARHHHERYDGTGYPDKLAGENIPHHARVISVADAYDAMHSDRVYRKGLSNDFIIKELKNGRGTQFDPVILDKFIDLFERGELDKIDRSVFEDYNDFTTEK